MKSEHNKPREYHLLTLFPITIWWLLVSIMATLYFARALGGHSIVRMEDFLYFIGPFVLAAFFAHHYRVRIDDKGVSTRYFLKWKTIPWEQFEGGRLHLLNGCTFVYAGEDSPTGRKRKPGKMALTIGLLNPRDRQEIELLILDCFKPAPPPKLPEEIEVALPPGKGKVVFSEAGIEYKKVFTPWSSVRRLLMEQSTAFDADFQRLEIALPQLTVEVTRTNNKAHINVEHKLVAAEALRQWSGEKLVTVAWNSAPQSEEEFSIRMERITADKKKMRRNLWTSLFCTIAVILLFFYKEFANTQVRDERVVVMVFWLAGITAVYLLFFLFYNRKMWLQYLAKREELTLANSNGIRTQ